MINEIAGQLSGAVLQMGETIGLAWQSVGTVESGIAQLEQARATLREVQGRGSFSSLATVTEQLQQANMNLNAVRRQLEDTAAQLTSAVEQTEDFVGRLNS
ncbi:MAG: hypothetical protein ABWY81_10910 [Jiangellaceae bacterium]